MPDSTLADRPTSEGFLFHFQGHALRARPSGALWWPEVQALVIADLHLAKSQRYARRGTALLPPWDTLDTLRNLHSEIVALSPARVIALGDSFDDSTAKTELSPEESDLLGEMARGRDWHWIEGNHDPGTGGVAEQQLGGLTLRHILGSTPDISGHYHPSIRLGGKRWRCFAWDESHLILPAFGSYTGGLDVQDPAFRAAMPRGHIIAGTSKRMYKSRFG